MTVDVQTELPQLRLGLLQLDGQIEKVEADLESLRTQRTRQEGIILYLVAKTEQQKQPQQPVIEPQA